MAELQLMSKMCEAAAKTIITTMSFLDLADYMLEGFYAGNKLEKVLTISSNDESKFYEVSATLFPCLWLKITSYNFIYIHMLCIFFQKKKLRYLSQVI